MLSTIGLSMAMSHKVHLQCLKRNPAVRSLNCSQSSLTQLLIFEMPSRPHYVGYSDWHNAVSYILTKGHRVLFWLIKLIHRCKRSICDRLFLRGLHSKLPCARHCGWWGWHTRWADVVFKRWNWWLGSSLRRSRRGSRTKISKFRETPTTWRVT